MTKSEERKLIVKALRSYANEHYGWAATIHPEDREKFNVLTNKANEIEGRKKVEIYDTHTK
jgi:hypothetical protein